MTSIDPEALSRDLRVLWRAVKKHFLGVKQQEYNRVVAERDYWEDETSDLIKKYNKTVSELVQKSAQLDTISNKLEYTSATELIKFMCKMYDKPYPIITVSRKRVIEQNAKPEQSGRPGTAFYLASDTYEKSEILLQTDEVLIDHNALVAINEVGHHIRDWNRHIESWPSKKEL